ncbi:hypothetical protein CspeluHIS016_0114200 [Cutaneotrichosporon spelunceum]|uniref:Phytanoyl-CoA dioxygenase n=1 Tax=Cutaneotrichosporon spelunceum TaxID=1672016 RepID=A0AAD3YAL2_9TREE|nr:hypothetical protein CspeluHIS016_0114200 [Cutaneotrichosporon spelunceum]
MAAAATMTMAEGVTHYPDPVHNVPPSIRTDGPRVQAGWDLDALKLEGNQGGVIPPSYLSWLTPIPADAPIEDIRAAYERDGVVHIRGLLNREDVLSTREKFFEFVAPSGVLKPGTSARDAIYNTALDPSHFPGPSATQFNRSQNDNALLDYSTRAGREDFIVSFSDQAPLLDFVSRLMPWQEPMRFRRQLLRTNIPRSYNTATRVHYDQMYLRKMEPGALTAWIPIGDVSPVSGGLLYLEGSREMGLEIERAFLEMNSGLDPEEQVSAFNQNMLYGGGLTKDCAAFARATNRRWLVGDYRAGDVVFHHSCMIHCSANNEDPEDKIRLATDVRFTDRMAPFDDRWNEFYYAGDGK